MYIPNISLQYSTEGVAGGNWHIRNLGADLAGCWWIRPIVRIQLHEDFFPIQIARIFNIKKLARCWRIRTMVKITFFIGYLIKFTRIPGKHLSSLWRLISTYNIIILLLVLKCFGRVWLWYIYYIKGFLLLIIYDNRI